MEGARWGTPPCGRAAPSLRRSLRQPVRPCCPTLSAWLLVAWSRWATASSTAASRACNSSHPSRGRSTSPKSVAGRSRGTRAVGHSSAQVVDEQLPFVARDDYDVGALSVGANDLQFGWVPERFEANMDAILARLAEAADRVVVTSVPPTFRRLLGADRQVNQSVPTANDIIVPVASEHGAHVVDLSDFTSRRWLRPDRAHPTALGSAEIGQRAAEALGLERAPADARRLGAAYSLRHAAGTAWHSGWLTIARFRRRSILGQFRLVSHPGQAPLLP